MSPKTITTWVLLANGAEARVLVGKGSGKGLSALPDAEFKGLHRRGTELFSDRPGRAFDSPRQGRHAMEPTTTAAEQEREAFLRKLAHWLGAAGEKGDFDRLAIVAAPKALGLLRRSLPHGVRDKVVCELDRDLTGATPQAVVESLKDRVLL